jgi:hypothetical protein
MEKLRYLNKSVNFNERNNFSNWNLELINVYGQEIEYYTNLTQLSSSYALYGEEPTAGFNNNPYKMVVLLNLNNDAYLLSKFGIVADSDLNGVIHPKPFEKICGLSAEPKAGDLVKLTEYGSDRLHYPKRGANVFEITEVIDEFQINPLGGHYMWFFKARRYDFSYEPQSPGAGGGNIAANDNDVIEQLSLQNFDYEESACTQTSVYGEY